MRDVYIECVAPKATAWWKKPLFGFYILLVIVCIYCGPPILQQNQTFGIAFLIAAGVFAFFAYKLRQSMNIEYEYLVLGNDMYIDKVINQKKRKRLQILRISKVSFFAPINAPQVYNYRRRASRIIDYSSGWDSNQYVMYYLDKLIILTPNKKLLEYMKATLPHNFIEG